MAKKDAKSINKIVQQAAKSVNTPSTKSSNLTSTSTLTNPFQELSNSITTTIENYKETLTTRLKIIDIFLSFLVAVGILQFLFCILVGNFPFNAFLGGFISTVGQFVLTVSLRLQSVDYNKKFFKDISPERAFGDYIFASLILHFIVYHFIN